jgi:hypothetical protein
MRATWLIAAAVLAAGCSPSSTPPPAAPTGSAEAVTSTTACFMGVPDDEGAGPVHVPAGIIYRISRVSTAEYADYLRAKSDKKVTEEMRCGRFQYYAVSSYLDVSFPNPGPGGASSGMFIVTDRHKAEIPPGE